MTTVQEYFDQCYPDYRRIWRSDHTLAFHYGCYDKGQKNHDKAAVRMNEVLASKAKVTSADRVLDAGCGIGGSAIWLAKNIGCSVTGIDINDKLLGLGQTLVKENGVDGLVNFCNMDLSHINFPDRSFDVVWALESACHAIDKLAFLREAKRLLRANGRLVVGDGFVTDSNIPAAVKKWIYGWAVPNLATIPDYTRYLRGLGFENVSFEGVTRAVMPSSRRMYWAGLTLFPLGKLLELLRVRTKVQTANIESAIYQHRTLVKGLWEYGIFTAQVKSEGDETRTIPLPADWDD